MHMMTWQDATRKKKTWQQQRITGRHLAHQSRGVTRAPYRTNPEETKEIMRQVQELFDKGYIRESLSPCVVPIILVPKKDDTSRMCVDCRGINNITFVIVILFLG